MIENDRERFEADINQRALTAQSYKQKDTEELVGTILYGRGITVTRAAPQPALVPQQNIQSQMPPTVTSKLIQYKLCKAHCLNIFFF